MINIKYFKLDQINFPIPLHHGDFSKTKGVMVIVIVNGLTGHWPSG